MVAKVRKSIETISTLNAVEAATDAGGDGKGTSRYIISSRRNGGFRDMNGFVKRFQDQVNRTFRLYPLMWTVDVNTNFQVHLRHRPN